jgi:hypothetical protein
MCAEAPLIKTAASRDLGSWFWRLVVPLIVVITAGVIVVRLSTGENLPTFLETTGAYTQTFADYSTSGGPSNYPIGKDEAVRVSCRIRGLDVRDRNPWWYRIASSPWDNRFYASADAYDGARVIGSLIGIPFVEQKVRLC